MKKYTGWMICGSLMLLITLVGSVQLFSYAKAHMTTTSKRTPWHQCFDH